MLNPLKVVTRPEYFFRPRQIFTRVRRALSRHRPLKDRVRLPWGQMITIRPRELIGGIIWYHGVFDLVVTEAICRLLDPGETALDIGANIGQMTSLMRYRAGKSGRVISFEPHPSLFAELELLTQDVPPAGVVAPVEIHQIALSCAEGEGWFQTGTGWDENRGMGKVVIDSQNNGEFKVRLSTLDSVLDGSTRIGVCKIDVEGHELQVFEGASRLFSGRRIRDIIFEEWSAYPSKVHHFLSSQGYELFSLHTTLLRPSLKKLSAQSEVRFGSVDGVNYLATLDSERAVRRFKGLGWLVLK